MIKLVIFDLDGTLLDTIGDLANSVNYALGTCGFPLHETSAYTYFVGRGINNLFYNALPEENRTEENIARIKEIFLPHYTIHNSDLTKPYPGIEQLLAKLEKDGIKLSVASNKYHEATVKMVSRHFPEINFCVVLGQREGIPTKPDPRIVSEIMEIAQVTPAEVLYVGDSGVDMQTAAAADIVSIGVSWGLRPVSELEKNGADHIVDRADEIYVLCTGCAD